MWHSKICHICLNSNLKLLIEDEDLKTIYLEIIGFDNQTKNTLRFCLNCTYYMKSFYEFKRKCIMSSEIINKKIFNKQKPKKLHKINRFELQYMDKHNFFNFYEEENVDSKTAYCESVPVVNEDVTTFSDGEDAAEDSNAEMSPNITVTDGNLDIGENDEEEAIKVEEPSQTKENKRNKIKLDIHTREGIELKRECDKRFKAPSDLQKDFKIEWFLTDEEQRSEFEKRSLEKSYLESKYQCRYCLKGFRNQKLFDLHNVKHEERSGAYLCKLCNVRVPNPKRYRTHRDNNHTSKFSCLRCDFVTFSKAQARNHASWHQGVEHSCPHCSMTFRKKTTYLSHLRILHPSSYICGSCANTFVSPYGLNNHIKLMHKDKNSSERNVETKECSDCNVTFDNYKVYIKHILISPKHTYVAANIIGCRDCGEEFATKELLFKHKTKHKHKRNERNKKDIKRTYKCTQCAEEFNHSTGLYQHFVRSHPNIPYKAERDTKHHLCELCGKTYMSQSMLLSHKRLHTGEKPYRCQHCEKEFRTKLSLRIHMHTHTSTKAFNCSMCRKNFSNSGNLFKHMRIHAGVKPFKCDICSKAFVDSSNLKQHINGVHYNVRRVRQR